MSEATDNQAGSFSALPIGGNVVPMIISAYNNSSELLKNSTHTDILNVCYYCC